MNVHLYFSPCFTESEFHFAEIPQTCNWEKGNSYALKRCPNSKSGVYLMPVLHSIVLAAAFQIDKDRVPDFHCLAVT